jgi:hypothetical protein
MKYLKLYESFINENENILESPTFLQRKQDLYDYLKSIGMDSDPDFDYADISEDGVNDTMITSFSKGNVTVNVGLCNFSNGEFKYVFLIMGGDEILLEHTFVKTIEEVRERITPYIEKGYEQTKFDYLGIQDKSDDYMPSKEEYEAMLNTAIDKKDWEEAKRLQEKYGNILYNK